MLIGIDASRARRKNRTGTENYTYYLLLNLFKIDRENQYLLYSDGDLPVELRVNCPKNFNIKIIKSGRGWSQLKLVWRALSDNLDLLFIPAHVLPFLYFRPAVVTLHGLEFKKVKENYSFLKRWYLAITTHFAAKKALQIIVPSSQTKQELIKSYRLNESKIQVIPHGSVALEAAQRLDFNLKEHRSAGNKPYLFFIGRLEPRKNIKGIIEAFLKFKAENSSNELARQLKLVLMGEMTPYFLKLQNQLLNKASFKNDVLVLGYGTDLDALCYLLNSKALIFPSLSEGFGMPLVDAMVFQVPIITSNRGSMKEIVGREGFLADPCETAEICAKIKELLLLKERDLCSKNDLSAAARSRFSFRRTAELTLGVFKKASCLIKSKK